MDSFLGSRRARFIGVVLVAAALMLGAVYAFSFQYFKREFLEAAARRAAFYKTTLEGELSRFEYLPFVLANDPIVVMAISHKERTSLNLRLQRFAREAEVDAIYFMDVSGLTVSSSNFSAEKTFLGQNYGFRPYFKQAMDGRRGRFYAIGATTALPGYFIAEPVRRGAALIGVIAVKVDLSPLQEVWRLSREAVFVENADGVIVLASNDDWLYRALRVIDAERRAEMAAQRQFAAEPLTPIQWTSRSDDVWSFAGESYLHAAAPIERAGWRLHYLASDGVVHERALLTTLIVAATLSVLLLTAIVVRSERLRAALQSSNEHRISLERTNRDLMRARTDLARATKMAALGQVAAAVTHELGQPISAMRNYLAAAEMSAPSERERTLTLLGSVVARLENATRQLKDFARPENRPEAEIDLRSVLDGVRLLMQHDVDAAHVTLAISAPDHPVRVVGDRLRLEQAVVNLARNAVAAMESSDAKHLAIRLSQAGSTALIAVEDTGHGFGARTLDELQEPFSTTRPAGEGMGLGLAITAAIMREHGGDLRARNGGGRGAVFTLTLPASALEAAA